MVGISNDDAGEQTHGARAPSGGSMRRARSESSSNSSNMVTREVTHDDSGGSGIL